MKIDHDFALIELDEAESAQYASDEEFKQRVKQKANRLSDATSRTVEIYDHAGKVLETVTNY